MATSAWLQAWTRYILAPALVLLSDWIATQPDDSTASHLKLLLYLAFILPLLGPFARWTHLQLTVPVMLAILYVVFQLGRRSNVEERRFSAA